MGKNKEELEKKMSQALEEGDMLKHNPITKARDQLFPKHEIRIPVKKDPIDRRNSNHPGNRSRGR